MIEPKLRNELVRRVCVLKPPASSPPIQSAEYAAAIVDTVLDGLPRQLVEDEDGAPFPGWIQDVLAARGEQGPAVLALARLLADDDEVPPPLRVIATRFLETRLYRADRPRERAGDPSTSAEAARKVRVGLTRPGGKIHRVLAAYDEVARTPENYPHGATAREIEFVAHLKAAHKRTSELLADGLLEVATYGSDDWMEGEEIVRKGGRVLRLTPDGRQELGRLNAAGRVKAEREAARAERRRRREARTAAVQSGT